MDENSNFRKENEGELSAFSTEHLTVGYDKMPLIKDVNLQVRPGEILTLIGPNGSGKSTILKTITRQLKQIRYIWEKRRCVVWGTMKFPGDYPWS